MPVTYHPRVDQLASVGDFSPVAEARPGELVAVAGQVGIDRTGALSGSSPTDQVRGAFENIGHALGAVGLGFGDVLSFTTYLVGRDVIASFVATRKQVFADIYPEGVYPPNTLVLVAGLVDERFVVEVEALAVRGQA